MQFPLTLLILCSTRLCSTRDIGRRRCIFSPASYRRLQNNAKAVVALGCSCKIRSSCKEDAVVVIMRGSNQSSKPFPSCAQLAQHPRNQFAQLQSCVIDVWQVLGWILRAPKLRYSGVTCPKRNARNWNLLSE